MYVRNTIFLCITYLSAPPHLWLPAMAPSSQRLSRRLLLSNKTVYSIAGAAGAVALLNFCLLVAWFLICRSRRKLEREIANGPKIESDEDSIKRKALPSSQYAAPITAPSSPRIQTQPESYYQLMLSLQPGRRSILAQTPSNTSAHLNVKIETPELSRPSPAIIMQRTPSSKSRATRRKSMADTVSLYSAASAPLEDHVKLFQPITPIDAPSSAPPWITSMPQPSITDADSGGGIVPGRSPPQIQWRPVPEIQWKTFGELSQVAFIPIQPPSSAARHSTSMSSVSLSTVALSSLTISDLESSSTVNRVMKASPGADISATYQHEASHLPMVRPLFIKVKERGASMDATPFNPPVLPKRSSMRTGKTVSVS